MACLRATATMHGHSISCTTSNPCSDASGTVVSFRCGKTHGYGDIRFFEKPKLLFGGMTHAYCKPKLDEPGAVRGTACFPRKASCREAQHPKPGAAPGKNRIDLVQTVAIQ